MPECPTSKHFSLNALSPRHLLRRVPPDQLFTELVDNSVLRVYVCWPQSLGTLLRKGDANDKRDVGEILQSSSLLLLFGANSTLHSAIKALRSRIRQNS